MRLVFLRYPFSCDSPPSNQHLIFLPLMKSYWTHCLPCVLYTMVWGRNVVLQAKLTLDVMWLSSRAAFHPQPHGHPSSMSRGRVEALCSETVWDTFPLSWGDRVCPSGQTGCCVKQQRPISDGISQSAPAGLHGRAGYQHQQRWLLVAPHGPT